jgi:hypothetical protein
LLLSFEDDRSFFNKLFPFYFTFLPFPFLLTFSLLSSRHHRQSKITEIIKIFCMKALSLPQKRENMKLALTLLTILLFYRSLCLRANVKNIFSRAFSMEKEFF